jgi:hypothetical protein
MSSFKDCIIPKVPPTPSPKKIENIHDNICDLKARFAGISYIQKDINMTCEDYLSEYDYWEIYSENKSYSKRPYQGSYKGIIRQYQNYLCILTDSNDNEDYYVIAKRIRGELEYLELYCPCLNCSSFRFNPLKYIWCSYCVGCIKAGPGFAKKEYIDLAKNLQGIIKNDSQYTNIFDYIHNLSFNNIKNIELLIIILFILIFIYYFTN